MRIDISSWKEIHAENRGVNDKVWVEDPTDGSEALYKETQIKDNSESTYADFAEAIVSDLCRLLQVPAARVELVEKAGNKGCISYNFCTSENEELTEIASVIQNTRPEFNSKSMIDQKTKEAYCVEMILEGLESVSLNKTNFAELRKAFLIDLLTDSLIDHYDRNPSNLSIIRTPENVRLSPKYDNGTSLSISVPQNVLGEYIQSSSDLVETHKKVRAKVLSKVGYLGRKFVSYPELESYLFNYHYDDLEAFVKVIQEDLTDENIEKMLSQEKYSELGDVHKEIIRGKLITNRDAMLERFRIISKKKIIDRIVYNKVASKNFQAHVKKGTIQEIIPEYNSCVGVQDEDQDYDLTLDMQIPEKIQTIVDITQLARFFRIPLDNLSKREKSLLKWLIIMENIEKASKDKTVFSKITNRLGFLEEDKKLISKIIKDKFKDENDLVEAREIIYNEKNGIGEENINLYIAKKFVDAANMRRDLRDKRMDELRTFAQTMKEAVELEHIAEERCPKTRHFQKQGMTDRQQIIRIKFELAKAWRENPRLTSTELYDMGMSMAIDQLKGSSKVEVSEGVFIDKEDLEEIRKHTIDLEDGKKLVLFDRSTKFKDVAFKAGADYFGQVSEHHSGNGVTLNLLTKKGVMFPKSVSEYAKQVIKKYESPKFPKGSFVLRENKGNKAVNCFIVTSINSSDAKIPNVTVPEMCEKLIKLFNEKEKDKSHLDE